MAGNKSANVLLVFLSTCLCYTLCEESVVSSNFTCLPNCDCQRIFGAEDLWKTRCSWAYLSNGTDFSLIDGKRTKHFTATCASNYLNGQLGDKKLSHFTNLESLTFIKCGMRSLTAKTFEGVSGLKDIMIAVASEADQGTGLEILPGVFNHSGLSDVDTLSFLVNKIKRIPPCSFCGLDRLATLNLTFNHIEHERDLGLGTSCNKDNSFNNGKCIPSLKALDLTLNYLRVLHVPLVDYSDLLEKVVLNNNYLTAISPELFHNLTHLKELDLAYNKLDEIHPDQFSGLTSLHVVYMGYNRLKYLPVGLFQDTISLEILGLQGNQLRNEILESNIIGHLSNLQALGLGANEISDLKGCSTFQELTKLKNLFLDKNQLVEIPPFCFRSQKDLYQLSFSDNALSNISNESFVGLSSLVVLYLDQNSIGVIQQGTFHSFRNSLSYLDLHMNHLGDMFYDLNNLSSLAYLDLSHNRINTWAPEAFLGVSNLKYLFMGRNLLKHIPKDAFIYTPALQEVTLSENIIESVENIDHMSQLVYLNLSQNFIKDIKFIFNQLPTLQYLLLNRNNISELSENMFPQSLLVLDVSENQISLVDKSPFFGIPFLNKVIMKNNPTLRKLSMSALRISTSLISPTLQLSGSRLTCDCEIPWILDINKEDNYLFIDDLSLVYCTGMEKWQLGLFPLERFVCNLSKICNEFDPHCQCCDSDIGEDICPSYCLYSCPDGCKCFRNHYSYPFYALSIVCEELNLTMIPGNIPPTATKFSFANNKMERLPAEMLKECQGASELDLHSNQITIIEPDAFKGIENLKSMDLRNNLLTSLTVWMFEHLGNWLWELYLNNNQISMIDKDSFSNLTLLSKVYLNNNSVQFINPNLTLGDNLGIMTISDNPWMCDCQYGPQNQLFISENAHIIDDINEVICDPSIIWPEVVPTLANVTNITFNDVTSGIENSLLLTTLSSPKENKTARAVKLIQANFEYCSSMRNNLGTKEIVVQEKRHIIAVATVGAVFLTALTISLIIYSLRELIKLWLFKHFGLRFYKPMEEKDKVFDAFISYSNKDEHMVVHELAPGLEAMNPPYKLCLHYRDWPVGASIAETIVQSVQDSRRTILLVSENFVQSEWCQYEFQAAHHQVLKDKKVQLIIILLQDIPPKKVDPQLKLYIQTNTYLKWNDPHFWDKLRYAMPDQAILKQGDKDLHEEAHEMHEIEHGAAEVLEEDEAFPYQQVFPGSWRPVRKNPIQLPLENKY